MSAIENTPEVCDFCGARTSDMVEFAATPEDINVTVTSLDGSEITATIPVPGIWRACSTCTQLIESGDSDALLQRSRELVLAHIGLLMRIPPERRRLLMREHRRGLKRLHDRFWQGLDEPEDDDDDDEPIDDANNQPPRESE